jgi:hypothetical protein
METAICTCCGELKPICCGSKTNILANGDIEYVDPYCPECCNHKPLIAWDGMSVAGGTFEVNS